jgi:hypothetical protein
MPLPLPLAALLALALPFAAHAAKDADLKPALATPGTVMVEDAFGSAELAKSWTANKGDVAIKDGAVVETFKASDNHAAVLTLGVPNHNSIIKFSFKLNDPAKGFALSYNSQKGHLFRVLVDAEGLTVMKDPEKDKAEKKAKAKAKSKSAPAATAAPAPDAKKARGGSNKALGAIAKAEGKIAPGEWHTMLVEVHGAKVTVQTDAGLKAEGTHPELDVEKTGYRFVTSASISLDDVKVWSVEQAPAK